MSNQPILFVTDLDNTLVGDKNSLKILNEKLNKCRHLGQIRIIYATGRSLHLYKQLLLEEDLLVPDALITSVGTEIYLNIENEETDESWSSKLNTGWERSEILRLVKKYDGLTLQPQSEQRPFKLSFNLPLQYAETVLEKLNRLLEDTSLPFKYIYSGGKDLDILPIHADKGLAVQHLRKNWSFQTNKTIVFGDSGNDIALFSIPSVHGVIVSNAQPELINWANKKSSKNLYVAGKKYAGGVLEGLKNFAPDLACF